MKHKRRRPKHQRAGCLYCKPHKDERIEDPPAQEKRAAQPDGENPSWEEIKQEVDGALGRAAYEASWPESEELWRLWEAE